MLKGNRLKKYVRQCNERCPFFSWDKERPQPWCAVASEETSAGVNCRKDLIFKDREDAIIKWLEATKEKTDEVSKTSKRKSKGTKR